MKSATNTAQARGEREPRGSDLWLTFYGDDFTGSTDVMEALTLGGVPAVLFLDVPDRERIATGFPHARAVGVAGLSRSLPTEAMEGELRSKFEGLRQLGGALMHYKICSTFDSSPRVGSIGRAIEVGRAVCGAGITPLVVGAPALRRYVAFGNLFATVDGQTFRLDRHPTMARHPVTPMGEADLRRHLGEQTCARVGLVDLLAMEGGLDMQDRALETACAGSDVILFDTVREADVVSVGRMVWEHRERWGGFVVGSSGLEYALRAHWLGTGLIERPSPCPGAGRFEPLLVVSGSASPATAGQIAYAERVGFESMRLDAPGLVGARAAEQVSAAVERAEKILASGRSVVLFSARGPEDPAIAATRAAAGQDGQAGERLGRAQGAILRALVERTRVRRVCVAGGDTSGWTSRALGIDALEVVAPIAPGSPLCRAHAQRTEWNGLEVALKGGQVGRENYFECIREGRALP